MEQLVIFDLIHRGIKIPYSSCMYMRCIQCQEPFICDLHSCAFNNEKQVYRYMLCRIPVGFCGFFSCFFSAIFYAFDIALRYLFRWVPNRLRLSKPENWYDFQIMYSCKAAFFTNAFIITHIWSPFQQVTINEQKAYCFCPSFSLSYTTLSPFNVIRCSTVTIANLCKWYSFHYHRIIVCAESCIINHCIIKWYVVI